MPNLFFTLDVPASNGTGAPTDVSAAGKEKTIQVDGPFGGTLNLEFSLDGGASWVTFASFFGDTKRVIPIAAQLIRVRRLGVPSIAPGLPDVFVSAGDSGGEFAVIPVSPASVDVSSFGSFRTVTVTNTLEPLNIEISDDGVKWTTCMTFTGPNYQSKSFTAKFMRATKPAIVAVGAINDAGPDTDELVKVSSNDTTAGFLNGKLVAGANITLTEQNDDGDESLEVSATVPASEDTAVFFFGNERINQSTVTRYMSPGNQNGLASSVNVKNIAVPRAGTVRRLYVRHNQAQGNGNNVTYEIIKNGVGTGVLVAIATGAVGQASDLVNTVAVAAGDRLGIEIRKASSIGNSGVEVTASFEVVY